MITMSLTTSGAPVKPTVTFLESSSLRVPHLLAGLQVERDQAPIDRADIEIALSDGDAAVVRRVRLLRHQFPHHMGKKKVGTTTGQAKPSGSHHYSGGPREPHHIGPK